MTYDFWQDRNEQNKYVRHNEFANLVLANSNFIINGCGLTASTGLTVSVALGKIYIAGTGEIDVTAGNLTADAAHATLNRIDLVVVNASGVKSLIKGTAATFPLTPLYTETSFVCLGHLYIGAAVTTLTSANVINSGVVNEIFSIIETSGYTADSRTISTTVPILGGGDLTANRTLSLDYNTTNLKLTSNKLNTIQDISATSTPTFAGATINSKNVNTYLAYLNQAVLTTSTPTFAGATLSDGVNMSGHEIINVDYIEFQGSDYIIRLEDDADTGIYYDSSANTWQWRLNGTTTANIDLDTGDFWTDGKVDCDGFKIGSSGTMTGIQTTLTNTDANLPTSGAVYDQLLTKVTAVGTKKVTVSTTAPASPAVGDLWIDSN